LKSQLSIKELSLFNKLFKNQLFKELKTLLLRKFILEIQSLLNNQKQSKLKRLSTIILMSLNQLNTSNKRLLKLSSMLTELRKLKFQSKKLLKKWLKYLKLLKLKRLLKKLSLYQESLKRSLKFHKSSKELFLRLSFRKK